MFRFTPAGSPGSKKSVTVALRSRGVSKAEAAKTMVAGTEAIAPSAYNLGVSIGWSRFALSGGIAKVDAGLAPFGRESVDVGVRSEEHTSELQSLMRISYAVFCLKK